MQTEYVIFVRGTLVKRYLPFDNDKYLTYFFLVHTTEDLAPGDEITTNYSIEENTDKRRKELKEKYGFDCECGNC